VCEREPGSKQLSLPPVLEHLARNPPRVRRASASSPPPPTIHFAFFVRSLARTTRSRYRPTMRRSSCGTAFIVLLGLSLLLSTSNAIPVGFTTFFSSATCPNGWYQLGTASGRLIVSVANSTVAGITVNTPLSDQEDRVHLHAYTTSVTLNSKNIAADDCCNGLGACSGTYVLNAATLSAPSGTTLTHSLS